MNINITELNFPYIEFNIKEENTKTLHKVNFEYEHIIENHYNEGQEQLWLGKDQFNNEWTIDVYTDYQGTIEEVHFDTISDTHFISY